MKRLDQLTFTRFIALLLVMFYHGAGGVYLRPFDVFPITHLLHAAPTAVSYLYVLSGFVMVLVYYRPAQKFDIRSYWTARFLRIYPLYIVSFLLVCYYYWDISRIKPQKILANIFVLQAWIPKYAQSFNYASWSMTVEFFFYAVFPFFIMWSYLQSTKKLTTLALVFWAFSQLVSFVLWIGYFPEQEMFIVYFPLFHLNSFIIGVVGGIWYMREGQNQQIKPSTVTWVFIAAVFVASVYTIISNIYTQLPHDLQPMSGLLSPIFTAVVIALAMDRSKISEFFSRPFLVTLGETSFALYILHVPVVWIWIRALENSSLPDPQVVLDFTYLPLMISVGLLAHFYVDRPLRDWLKKVLRDVSMPLLVLDLALIALSVYLSFRLRFGDGREYFSYRSTSILMFWAAFILRTVLSVYFRAFSPSNLYGGFVQFIRPVLLSVTLGSALVMGVMLAGFSAGWFENFPRSIFAIDWALMVGTSLLVRFLFRLTGIYKKELSPA
ncbi:MAG: acyltransferase family protein [Anaerolineales bacterium]|nr:acyltransferase family protein [Anaerolineales bacterium]